MELSGFENCPTWTKRYKTKWYKSRRHLEQYCNYANKLDYSPKLAWDNLIKSIGLVTMRLSDWQLRVVCALLLLCLPVVRIMDIKWISTPERGYVAVWLRLIFVIVSCRKAILTWDSWFNINCCREFDEKDWYSLCFNLLDPLPRKALWQSDC